MVDQLKPNIITKDVILGGKDTAKTGVLDGAKSLNSELSNISKTLEIVDRIAGKGLELYDKLQSRRNGGFNQAGGQIQDRKIQILETAPKIVDQTKNKELEGKKVSEIEYKVEISLRKDLFKSFVKELIGKIESDLPQEYKDRKISEIPKIYTEAEFLLSNYVVNFFDQNLYGFLEIKKVLLEKQEKSGGNK